jgi:hypothetical protein
MNNEIFIPIIEPKPGENLTHQLKIGDIIKHGSCNSRYEVQYVGPKVALLYYFEKPDSCCYWTTSSLINNKMLIVKSTSNIAVPKKTALLQ